MFKLYREINVAIIVYKDLVKSLFKTKIIIIVKRMLNIISTKRNKGGYDNFMKKKEYNVLREFSKANTLEEILIYLLRERIANGKYAC